MSGYLQFTPAVAVAATGTITIVDFESLTAQEITINEVTLTAGAEWTVGLTNAATATSIASAITTATATTLATATATDATVTITANTAGAAGNAIAIAFSPDVESLEGGSDASLSTVLAYSVDVNFVSAKTHATEACTLKLYDGTAATDTLVLTLTCPQAKSSQFKLGKGIRFSTGCFLVVEAADEAELPSSVTVGYEKV